MCQRFNIIKFDTPTKLLECKKDTYKLGPVVTKDGETSSFP